VLSRSLDRPAGQCGAGPGSLPPGRCGYQG
jgi:hypothetical protein